VSGREKKKIEFDEEEDVEGGLKNIKKQDDRRDIG
jgi:hypothetical protein